jgi:mannose-6-phosphate isomerase
MYALTNEPRDYAWGAPGGISRALGRPVASEAPEAELWLGAHPGSPSRLVDAPWPDLRAWEEATGRTLPFLFKLLSAAAPLSIQAHPAPDRATQGFADEEARGIPRGAPDRNYRDPHAKPELLVAVEDGFEALCGFRPVAETRADVERLAQLADHPGPFHRWAELLRGPDPVAESVGWLLGDSPSAWALAQDLSRTAALDPERFDLVARLAAHHPGDAGIAVALMLNHVLLASGECLWLPAGNIHAYVRGVGVELMGPSDNVLRGGLTPKHVDVPELLGVLDTTQGPPPHLVPEPEGDSVRTYRPASVPTGADVPFELREVRGDARVDTSSPAILLVLDGDFDVTAGGDDRRATKGDALFVADPATIELRGAGRAFVASATSLRPRETPL